MLKAVVVVVVSPVVIVEVEADSGLLVLHFICSLVHQANEVQGVIDRVFALEGRSAADRTPANFSRQRSIFGFRDGMAGKIPQAALDAAEAAATADYEDALDHNAGAAEAEATLAKADDDAAAPAQVESASSSGGGGAAASAAPAAAEPKVTKVQGRKLAIAGWNFDPPMHDENMLAFKEGETLVILETVSLLAR